MGGFDKFEGVCRKNLREILVDIFSDTGSAGNFSQPSLQAVTGPLEVDENNNPSFGEVVATGALVEGPTKKKQRIEYSFKFDNSDEDRKRVKYHILSLNDKVISFFDRGAPPAKGYPYYIKIGIAFNLIHVCYFDLFFGRWALLLDKKTYTKYFGAIDGAPESELTEPITCFGAYPTSYSIAGLFNDDYIEAILDACISGSVSSFFNEITIHNKSGKCLDSCSSDYFVKPNSDCFNIVDSDKVLTVTRDIAEKIALRCIFPYAYSYRFYPDSEKTEICRYIFPVSGNESKFEWAGLLSNNKIQYLLPPKWYFVSYGRLNVKGKPIKIVIHFAIG